jgi:hypothetical protein
MVRTMPSAEQAGVLLAKTIAAHGGSALWENAGAVSVEVSSGGLAFASKLQGHAVRGVRARIAMGTAEVHAGDE